MANAREQMKTLEAELDRVRDQIQRLKIEEALLVKLISQMTNGDLPAKGKRQRSPSVKPVVLDIMNEAGSAGATTADVDEKVRMKVPTVAKDTVGSILSRLKSDGALVYDGERYYEKRFAPKERPNPFDLRMSPTVQ